MLNAIPTILTVLAFALVVARPLAPVVVTWLDRPDLQRWAWLPPAVVLALSVLSDRLLAIAGAPPALSPDVSATLQTVEALVQSGLAVAIAYQRGHAAPPVTVQLDAGPVAEKIAEARKALDRVGPAALLVLLVAAGCQPRSIRDVCSPLGYAAVDAVCLEIGAPAVARQCGSTPPEDCPEAIAAVATCEMVRAEQERSCR